MEAPWASGRAKFLNADRALKAAVLDKLRSVHALKTGALSMFDPMLHRVAAERDSGATPKIVAELLARMHGAFSAHRTETADHVRGLSERLQELGGTPAGARMLGLTYGAKAWVALGGIGGQNHGANARNAFVFEHLEIASLQILRELADRNEDEVTSTLADRCAKQDQEMAATIGRNWTNVSVLMLASSAPTAL